MTLSRRLSYLCVISAGILAGVTGAGCPPVPPLLPNLLEVAQDQSELTTFVAAVQAADLDDELADGGPFTVFAPNNAAFGALPAGALDDLLLPENQDTLVAVLQNHIVEGTLLAANLQDGQVLQTLGGDPLVVSIENGTVFVGGARVVTPNLLAVNGVIHIIDEVLLPPENVVVTAAEIDELDTLVVAVDAADLDEQLATADPITVFAPNNAAFQNLPVGELARLLLPANRDELAALLQGHVVADELFASELSDGQVLTTLSGTKLVVEVTNGTVTVGGAQVVRADIVASNGVIHIIDEVLLPPQNLFETAADIDALDTFTVAVAAADLDDELATGGPFTVFAPNNQAFLDLPVGALDDLLLPLNQAQLVDVLQGHIVAGQTFARDLSDGQTLTTLSGRTITVNIANGTISVDGAQVVEANIVASNGVIHIIDAVLLPPE